MLWVINFCVLGAFSILAQTILFREFLVVFYGNEVTIGLFFATWFLGIALGAKLYRHVPLISEHGLKSFALMQVLVFPNLLLQIAFVRYARRLLDVPLEAVVPLTSTALIAAILTIPLGLFIGLSFPLSVQLLHNKRRDSASGSKSSVDPLVEPGDDDAPAGHASKLYLFEALGSLLSGLAVSLVLIARFSHIHIAVYAWICGWLFMSACLWALSKRTSAGLVGFAALLMLVLSLAMPETLDRMEDRFEALRWRSLNPQFTYLDSTNTPYQHAAIGKIGSQYTLFGDGHMVTSFPETSEDAKMAALLMAEQPFASNILIIGYAPSGLIRELLKFRIEQIDVVFLDRKMFELSKPYLPKEDLMAMEHPRVSMHFVDGCLEVLRLAEQKRRFDTVYLSLPDPSSAFLNRYYTVEFFKDVRKVLAETGIFVCEVSSAENFFSKEVASHSGSIYKSLGAVFEQLVVTPGENNLFVAGFEQSPISDNYLALSKRHQNNLHDSPFPPLGFKSIFPPERIAFTHKSLNASFAQMNFDRKPITYFYNLMLWSSFTGEEYLKVLQKIHLGGWRVFLIPLVLLFILRLAYTAFYPAIPLERHFNNTLAMGLVAAISMGLQLMFLYAFQARFGYVYEQFGLMVALFMAGLAVATFLASRTRCSLDGAERCLMIYFGSLAALIYCAHLRLFDSHSSSLEFYTWIAGSGFWAGLAFPLLIRVQNQLSDDPQQAVSLLDSYEHLGAAAGALLVGSIMIPILGYRQSAFLMIALCLVLAILILKTHLEFRRVSHRLKFDSFPFNRLSWILIIGALAMFLVSHYIRMRQKVDTVHFDDRTLTSVSGSDHFQLKQNPLPHYLGANHQGTKTTRVFASVPTVGAVRGYGGVINLLVGIDDQGTIIGLNMVQHYETPGYVAGIDEWLKGFSGQNLLKDFPHTQPIDGFSGATVSSKAIVEILDQSAFIAEGVLGLHTGRKARQKSALRQLIGLESSVVMLVFILSLGVYLKAGRKTRLALLVLNTAVLGFWLNLPFTFVDLANLSLGKIPGLSNSAWIVSVVLIGLSSLFFGQFYCGYICPFGALQEIIGEIGKPLRRVLSKNVDWFARYLKYLLLAVGLVGFWATDHLGFLQFSPMQFVFKGQYPGLMLWCVLIVLGLCVFYFRFWCRYFCPVGAFLSLFNKLAFWERHAPKRVYSQCDLGVKGSYDVDCLKCNRCTLKFQKTT